MKYHEIFYIIKQQNIPNIIDCKVREQALSATTARVDGVIAVYRADYGNNAYIFIEQHIINHILLRKFLYL